MQLLPIPEMHGKMRNLNVREQIFGLNLEEMRRIEIALDRMGLLKAINKHGVAYFNSCCEVISRIKPDYREVVLQFLDEFLWLGEDELYRKGSSALDSAVKSHHKKCERFFVVPCLGRSELYFGSPKSGHRILYILGDKKPLLEESYKVKIEMLQDPRELKNRQLTKDDVVFACDDFAGSGSTAEEFSSVLRDELGGDTCSLHFVFAVAHIQAVECLNKKNQTVSFGHMSTRAIADSSTLDKELAYDAVKQISDPLIASRHALGKYESQALVGMMRTPNNTLALFWCHNIRGGEFWPCPFPRFPK